MYSAGWSKHQIAICPDGYAMQGYGMWHHRARRVQLPLFARCIYLQDSHGRELYVCCLDLGYITHAMRDAICRSLWEQIGPEFDEERLVLTCTHTHSGPGGCTHDVLYNVVTPGFVPGHLDAITTATVKACLEARADAAPTQLFLSQGHFADTVPVAWNRSIDAFNRNPDVTRRQNGECHLALDRSMPILGLKRNGNTGALISLFGVHATCVGNTGDAFDGDNKGYAALATEQALAEAGADGAVAIFAQGTAGDVSPHYHGPGDRHRRRRIRERSDYAYARENGQHQADLALATIADSARKGLEREITGPLDGLLSYRNFARVRVPPEFAAGETNAATSDPCHGVSFFTGTPIDGPGMPTLLARPTRYLARRLRRKRLQSRGQDRQYYQRLYDSQGAKDILLESSSKKLLGMDIRKFRLPDLADPSLAELKRQARIGAMTQSEMVPSVLPIQIITLGDLALICCPGEFTTTAGKRLRELLANQLQEMGVRDCLLFTYCNDYMGYVTTREEYQLQRYEGGHTVFGQWTLAAFQSEFTALARSLGEKPGQRSHDRNTRPPPVPEDELALRSNLSVPE